MLGGGGCRPLGFSKWSYLGKVIFGQNHLTFGQTTQLGWNFFFFFFFFLSSECLLQTESSVVDMVMKELFSGTCSKKKLKK